MYPCIVKNWHLWYCLVLLLMELVPLQLTSLPSTTFVLWYIKYLPLPCFSSLKYGVYHSAMLLYDTASAGPRSSLSVTPDILFVQHCFSNKMPYCCQWKLPLLIAASNKILSSTPALLTTISDWISLQVAISGTTVNHC